MITLYELITLISIIAAIALLLFLLQLDRIKPGNRIYIYVLISAIIIVYFIEILIRREIWNTATILFTLNYTILFSIYPLFYLYIKRLVFTEFELKKEKYYLHFIIPDLIFVLSLVLYLPMDYQEKILLIKYKFEYTGDVSLSYRLYNFIIVVLYYIQFSVYLVLLFRLHSKAKENMVNKILQKNIVIRFIKVFITTIIVYESTLIILFTSLPRNVYDISGQVSSLIFLVLLGWLCVYQSTIEIQTYLRSTKFALNTTTSGKSIHHVSNEEKEKIHNLIIKVLSQKKLFVDPNLKLEQFAKKIHVSPRKLSVVINEITDDSFITLLNKFRIEEAKKLLKDSSNPDSIEEIYLSSGFNSRSTFNRVFKEFTGLTPKEFKSTIH